MNNADIIIGNKYNYKLCGHNFKVIIHNEIGNYEWEAEYVDDGKTVIVHNYDLEEIDDCCFLI
jgi:hypothetical protein